MAETTKAQPRCWWCGEARVEVREMEAGSERVAVCAMCWLALETLRERAAKGRGVG